MLSLALLVVAVASSAHALPKGCPILFDGRVPLLRTAADFDKNTSVYDHQFVHGENQTWADILKFPVVLPSLFDLPKLTKAVEVTISDTSIFVPGGGPPQVGFRRSELIPALNTGSSSDGDPTVQPGHTTTFHWSLRTSPHRPLNYSHEYHPVWHETADFSTSEFTFQTGTPFNASFESPMVKDPKTLRLAGRQSNSPETIFFSTPFIPDIWHNFALSLGWSSNELTLYYSSGYAPLRRVVGPVFNDNAGGGQWHVGMLKLPTGPLGIDVLHEGSQQSHLDEGLIYGGLFVEDSTEGCVTTSLL